MLQVFLLHSISSYFCDCVTALFFVFFLIKIKKMPRKTKAPKWSNHHNEELNARFASGEVTYQNLSPEVIRAVIAQFYPDRTYESFSRIIRVKAKKYIMEQNLHKGRSKFIACFKISLKLI